MGRADETWQAMEVVAGLGGEAWFQLGDRDLGFPRPYAGVAHR